MKCCDKTQAEIKSFTFQVSTDLMSKEMVPQNKIGVSYEDCSPSDRENIDSCSRHSSETLSGVETCRVCQCLESDRRGDAALEFLGIDPPLRPPQKSDEKVIVKEAESEVSLKRSVRESRYVEFVSPDGEVLVCQDDLEMGLYDHEDTLIELGCSCKNDLAFVHYACALKWFVNHGSTICEICGDVAKNIRTSDFRKVIVSLKEYEALRERTASGEPNPAHVHTSTGVDPDAVAAIRRQRLSEISLWFGPHNTGNNNNSVAVSEAISEPSLNVVTEEAMPAENTVTKWAVEGTGILLATGLLTVTLAWLIAPRVGKKTAKNGLHILLGGICALAIVVFFRFFVLTRIKYGPARYWAILFVFWFLVFGIWASRTHGAHST